MTSAHVLPDVRRAVVYGRISDDDPNDTRDSVDEQLRRAQEHVARRGWELVGVYRDDGVSAHSGTVRPQYERVRADIAAGRADTIVVRHIDRLGRNDLEQADARDFGRRHRVLISEYGGMEYPLWTAQGQHMARTMGGNATFESDIKGERVKEKAELRARQGRMNGVCPFGWRREYERTATGRVIRSWEVTHEPEAGVVREITDRLLRGDSLVGITADLNRRGVPAPGAAFTFRKKDRAEYNADGALWNKTSVKKLALRASNAGLRAYKGELLPGEWPPLVDRKDWDSVKRLLDAPGRDHRKTDVRPGRREHLLTWGVGYCGVCGGLLRVGRKGSKKYERPEMYLCAEQNLLGRNRETGAPAPKCCVGRRKEWVDELVRKVVIARLSQPDALAALSPDAHELADACARRDAAQADLDAIAAMTGKRPVSFLLAMSEEPQARLEAAEDEIRRLQGAAGDEPILAELAGPQVAERWDAMPVAARRRVLEILGVRVLIDPNTKHGPGFDPESVRVEEL